MSILDIIIHCLAWNAAVAIFTFPVFLILLIVVPFALRRKKKIPRALIILFAIFALHITSAAALIIWNLQRLD